VLSQQLRAAHRLETAKKTSSDSLSVSVCFLLATCRGFPEGRVAGVRWRGIWSAPLLAVRLRLCG